MLQLRPAVSRCVDVKERSETGQVNKHLIPAATSAVNALRVVELAAVLSVVPAVAGAAT